MKTIIAIADSEGTPHRGDGKSSLWNFCAIMKYIVDSDTYELLEECYHTFHFSMPKYITRSVVKKSLNVHFEAINHIRQKYDCDEVCFCFWNSPHDLAVLNYYDMGKITTVDLLALARKLTNNIHDSYSISNLCRKLGVESKMKLHTGLGDVVRLVELLPKLNITDTRLLSPHVKNGGNLCDMMKKLSIEENMIVHKSKYSKPNTKHNAKETTGRKSSTTTEKTKERCINDATEKKSGSTRGGSNKRVATRKGTAIRRARENNSTGTQGNGFGTKK